MNSSVSHHERVVIDFYDRTTDDFYLTRWDTEDIHFGIFLPGESIYDEPQSESGDQAVLKRAVRRMTEAVIGPAQIRPDDLVVDAGCGVGGTSIYLAKVYGCRVSGVNINKHQLNIANSKADEQALTHLVDFKYGDCSSALPFEDDSVDVVVNLESACHYSDRETFLGECARILKPGGRLVAQDLIARDEVDQRELIKSACDAWAMRYPLETFRSYRHLLEANQFKVTELTEIKNFMPTIDCMNKGLNYLRAASKSGHKCTSDQMLWMRQFESMVSACYADHLTLLQYHASMSAAK